MKYVIGKLSLALSGEFRTRYTCPKCIEAASEEEALAIYNKDVLPTHYYYAKCIGILEDDGSVKIYNYSKKFKSGETLSPAPTGTYNHLVSRLLEEPKSITEFSLYCPKFIQAACPEDALSIYNSFHNSDRFKAYILGYVDENDSFVIPNIMDYVKEE